ncbi:MAG: serine hydrolase domain-containing protein [Bacteroidota bacterium]
MKYLFFILILVIFFSCRKAQIGETRSAGPEPDWNDTSAKHPKNETFRTLIEKYREKGLPGISLLVNDANGTWIGATGKADIANDIDFVPGTNSKAASITKLFINTLLFRLMEDSSNTGIGYNAINTKIDHWLPSSVISKLPNGRFVTLGQCMNHETGIPDVIEQDAFYLAVLNNPNKNWQPEELLEFIYNKPPLFIPSDTAIYSNTNTILIKMVIETATGKSHADLLKQYVLTPLHLKNTFYQPYDKLPNNTAQGYFDLYNNNTLVNVSNLVTGSGNGYGGLYSNVYDLLIFIKAFLIDRTLLQPASLNRMTTFTGKRDGSNYYGYGLQKSFLDHGNDYGIGHKGRDLGYTANLFYFPGKKVTHIFFINYGTDSNSRLKKVFNDFQDELLKITLG